MNGLPMSELERLCQKPDHRRVGNWMARRVARPAALRITKVIAPWGVSANLATLVAWGCGMAAAVAFGGGSMGYWLLGAVLLQAWYLLDHVDGQLARLHGTASLDGVQLDYLMHHTINLLVPIGIGFGLFVRAIEPVWLLVGLAWGVALLLLTLHHDARYRTFFKRLKRLHGTLRIEGGGGGRPEPQPNVPRNVWRVAAWIARKVCETHVVMNLLTLVALVGLILGDVDLTLARGLTALLSMLAVATALWTIGKSQQKQAAEEEFAAWFRVSSGDQLVFREGWWYVANEEDTRCANNATTREDREIYSS